MGILSCQSCNRFAWKNITFIFSPCGDLIFKVKNSHFSHSGMGTETSVGEIIELSFLSQGKNINSLPAV